MKKKLLVLAVMAVMVLFCWPVSSHGEDFFAKLEKGIDKEFFRAIDESRKGGVEFNPIMFSLERIKGLGIETTFSTIDSGRVRTFKCLSANSAQVRDMVNRAVVFFKK